MFRVFVFLFFSETNDVVVCPSTIMLTIEYVGVSFPSCLDLTKDKDLLNASHIFLVFMLLNNL